MIVKVSKMRATSKSSIKRVGKYVLGTQDKQERLGRVLILNCNNQEPTRALLEMEALQKTKVNVKGDKTLHLIVGFSAKDRQLLTENTIRVTAEKIVKELGYEGHQCLVVQHNDTDSPHFHIVLNKINPTSGKMVEHWQAYKILANVANELEDQFGFTKANHSTRQNAGASRAKDLEAHRGHESFIGYLKSEIRDKISTVESWEQFHSMLAELGVTAKLRGNGLVFVNEDGMQAKASSVGREFSKAALEKRFGPFDKSHSPTLPGNKRQKRYSPKPLFRDERNRLYQEYLGSKEDRKASLNEKFQQLKQWRSEQYDIIRNEARIAKAANRLMVKDWFNRRITSAMITETARQRREHLREQFDAAKEKIFEEYGNRSWVDFLRTKASAGDETSLRILRNRSTEKIEGSGNKISTVEKVEFTGAKAFAGLPQDQITKRGTVIYADGRQAVRDRGHELQVSDAFGSTLILRTLREACSRYGQRINVTGTDEFKAAVVVAAARHGLTVEFEDIEMNRSLNQLRNEVSGVRSNGQDGTESRRSVESGRGAGGHSERGILFEGREGRREDGFAEKIRESFVEDWWTDISGNAAAVAARSRVDTIAEIRGRFNTETIALPRMSKRDLGEVSGWGRYESSVHLQIGRRHGQTSDIRSVGTKGSHDHVGGGMWRSRSLVFKPESRIMQSGDSRLCESLVAKLNTAEETYFYPIAPETIQTDVTYEGTSEYEGNRYLFLKLADRTGLGVCSLRKAGWSESRTALLTAGEKVNIKTGLAEKKTGRKR